MNNITTKPTNPTNKPKNLNKTTTEMKTQRTKEIRATLVKFVSYEVGEQLRKELKAIADETYVQKYSDSEQIGFLERNQASIHVQVVSPQAVNFPYYLEMFTVVTQHIYADNLRQLVDIGLDIEKGLKGRRATIN